MVFNCTLVPPPSSKFPYFYTQQVFSHQVQGIFLLMLSPSFPSFDVNGYGGTSLYQKSPPTPPIYPHIYE